MRKYKIGVVCAAGMATSSVIKIKLEEELGKRGIEANIVTLKALDASSDARSLDLIVTSTLLQGNLGIPIIRGISILTGIGMEETMEEVIDALRRIKKDDGIL